MTLTSSQFQFVKDLFGNMGLFAVIVGWEHVMLFIKYLMHSLVSPYPASVTNAIKEEEYQKNEQRNTSMREKNERRSNVYGTKPKSQFPTLHFDSTDDEYSRQSGVLGHRMNNDQNGITKFPSKVGANDHVTIPPDQGVEDGVESSSSGRKSKSTQQLRRRVVTKIESKKNSNNTTPRSPVPNPTTPKRTSRSTIKSKRNDCRTTTPQKGKLEFITTNSPFGLYFHENNIYSPLDHRTSTENDEISIGDLLSLNSGNFDDPSTQKSKQHRPSMSRSRFVRESIEQERAAQLRIRKRISSVGERRRKKTDRYML